MEIIRETRVVSTKSLLTMRPGERVEVKCVEFVPMNTAQSAVSRLNARSGWVEFRLVSPDNGATLIITRDFPPQK